MANLKVMHIMRDAIKNSESGSSFIVKAPILGQREETIQFSATKGNKILCAIGIETSLAVTALAWGGANTVANAAKQAYMIDDLRIRVDNQLRVDSSNTKALIEWCDLVMDRVQSDTVLAGNGTAHSYHIIPVSGVGGADVLIDIDYSTFADMYTAGGGTPTEGAKTIILTPIYTTVDLPVFGIKTASAAFATTGSQKLQVDADYLGNGYLSEFIGIPNATTLDDFSIKESNGLELFNAKYLATARFWQNSFQKTIETNSWGVFVESTHPWTLNDRIQIDVSAGTPTVEFCVIFKNSSTEGVKKLTNVPTTPVQPVNTQPGGNVATTGRLDSQQIIANPAYGGTRQGLIGGLRGVLGV